MKRDIKIISGGQSGVDRAALDFALQNQISCGGWCPRGRIAEDGRINKHYPLRETDSTEYRVRTHANVQDCDGTLILYRQEIGNGTALTQQIAKKLQKPCLLLKLGEYPRDRINVLDNWLKMNKIKTLNIAGPRESNNPGIYVEALKFLESAF